MKSNFMESNSLLFRRDRPLFHFGVQYRDFVCAPVSSQDENNAARTPMEGAGKIIDEDDA
jgi:hypothetical protein